MLESGKQVRLTATERAELQRRAAKHGYAIGPIRTHEDHLHALCKADPEKAELILRDLEEFLETGSSPLIRGEVQIEDWSH